MNTWRFSGQVRKIRVVMLVLLFGLFGSFHLSIAQDGNDASSTLIDASSNNFPPMNVLDKDGNLTGFGCDLSDAVMKAVGRQVTHIHSPHWVQVLEWLDSGKADFIHDTGYTKDRDKFLDYSNPIIEMPEVIFVRPDQYDVTDIDSLKGKTVACVKKHITDLHLQKFPEINRHVVKTPIEGLYELITGKVDAFIYPKQIVLYLAQKLRLGDKIKIAGDPLRILTWSMVVKEGNEKVLNLLNQGIAKVRESGEYERIYDKWWGKKILAGYSKRELYVITAVTTGGTLLIALTIALLLFNRRLSKGKKGLKAEIVERKRAEEALRESEQQYRSLVESTEDSIYLVDRNSTYLFMNEKHLSRLGLQPDEILGRIYGEFHSEDDTQEFAALMEKIFETGQSIQQEHRSLKDNRHFLRTLSPIKEPKGRTRAITVVSKDITERGRLEEVLRESEEKFRTFTEMAPVGVFVTDADGLTTYWNKRLCEITGMQVVDGLGAGWADGVHPDDRERVFKEWYESAEKRASFSCEYRFVDRDGAVTYTIGQAIPLTDASMRVTGYVGTITDVTDLKRAEAALRESEEKLARSEKMEAMGLMAGGVAHDLNNILSGVVSLPELLLMNLPEDSPIRKPIKTIQESGMRAADVVEDLMTIARGVASSKEPLNLNTMVEEYLKSAEHFKLERTHSFVSFKTELDPTLLNMSGSPTHIKKILMNLVANASEAIEGSGTVTISTLSQYLDMPLKGYEDVRTGEYAVVTVSDDGSGISPGDLERIFEPFYTKKVMGRAGTGLGLAVVWNTTQDYNGYINVNSSEKGTTFELYFPVIREEVAADKEQVALEDYLGHGENILVVDDDENQREIASGMLTQLGYKAESVSSGEDAIEYIKEHSVDLIVLDMVMPKGINGRKTYEEIIKIRPGQKAVIASGYAKSKEVDIAQGLGAGKYIKKPYILEKIGVAVKEELEK